MTEAGPTLVHRRGRSLAVAVAVALAVVAVATSWGLGSSGGAAPATVSVPVGTATVVRTDLSTTTQLSGTLGFGDTTPLTAPAPGVLTWAGAPGQEVSRGQVLYELDGAPVLLLYGTRPSWRTLTVGVTPGPDVRQLEDNLVALGYAALTPDDRFTWTTAAAVQRWQAATARPVTGRVDLGAVAFTPGAVRVRSVPAALGASVGPGQPVVLVTGTAPVVTCPVPAVQAGLVHVDDAVQVTLPDGTTTPARVTTLSTVATAADQGGGNGGSGGAGSSGQPQATVPAQIALSDPTAAAHLDQAPVTVTVTDRTVTGVLAVPVTALVARAGGGYGVWKVTPAGRRLVGVTPGLFARTLVQVSGAGLAAGDRVEVPSS